MIIFFLCMRSCCFSSKKHFLLPIDVCLYNLVMHIPYTISSFKWKKWCYNNNPFYPRRFPFTKKRTNADSLRFLLPSPECYRKPIGKPGIQLQLRANREGGVPTLLIGRNDLCAVLLEAYYTWEKWWYTTYVLCFPVLNCGFENNRISWCGSHFCCQISHALSCFAAFFWHISSCCSGSGWCHDAVDSFFHFFRSAIHSFFQLGESPPPTIIMQSGNGGPILSNMF